ncbi:MAG: DnaJ domain-containing protein [Chitinophagaceae bacterium]
MYLKDYYQILELEPSASLPEVKKAYRKLAKQYHPDKNNNDPYATALFADIKEAYEMLTDPAKKEYYLQQRWYHQSTGNRKTQEVITPVTVLKQALELEQYVSKIDVFRMDKMGLQQYIMDLIPDTSIEKLHQFNEPDTIRQIVSILLHAIKPLPPIYTKDIFIQLKKLSDKDPVATEQLNIFIRQRQKKSHREKYSLVVIIILTIIISLFIYLLGR